MTFWTTEKINDMGETLVTPFRPAHVQQGSYELSMGGEAFVTGGTMSKGESHRKTILEREGDQVMIPPGQFALLLTEEDIKVPSDAIAWISIRSSYKLHGLINVSGFHVDPGFNGRLLFSVYNAGGNVVVLSRGERIFLIWWASLIHSTRDLYKGNRDGQSSIRNSDISQIGHSPFSPAAVNRRLEELETSFNSWYRFGINASAAVVGAVIGGFIGALVAVLF